MNSSAPLPETAFLRPDGSNREAIAAVAQLVLEQLLNLGSQADQRSPVPTWQGVEQDLGIPAQSVPLPELLTQLEPLLAQSMNPANPGYLGHMDPVASTASVIGDAIAALLNNNLLSVEMSPSFSRLETTVLRELAQRFGLGDKAGGLLLSGGSLANLQAIALARNWALQVQETGLAGLAQKPVLFASEAAHTSIQKAAMLLGLGSQAVIPIATDRRGRMQVAALTEAIALARRQGQRPFGLVATAGTTVTGSIDPLPELGAIARAEGLWFHVDASYGGAVIFSPRYRHKLKGIEQADSVTFNPQKWLCVAKTSASLLLRDWSLLTEHFRIAAPYMGEADDLINLGEVSVQGTRPADILKLWLTLQHFGDRGCEALVDHGMRLGRSFVAELRQRPQIQVATPPDLNILCFRLASDRLTAELQQSLLGQNFFLSLPRFRDRLWLKAVLVNPFTTSDQVRQLFGAIDAFCRDRQIQPDPQSQDNGITYSQSL